MSTSLPLSSPPSSPAAATRDTPAQTPPQPVDAHGEDLDLEEDIAPNLGGEDQMQDA